MSKVYFIPINSYNNTKEINSASKKLLEKIQNEEKVLDFKKNTPLKVHFGEDKNNTFIESKNFVEIINYLKQKKSKTFYIETNVLYKGKRTTKKDHLNLAKAHAFTQIPIIIADGESGEDYKEIDISKYNTNHFKKCKIGKKIAEQSQMIVLAHFKGHILAGFGGAIKQLSMGCASRGGKLAMHSQSKPILNPLKCKKCYACAKNCPTNACNINAIIPHINYSKCIGCAKCIAICPHNAMQINWANTTPKKFREKLAEYALAAQKNKKMIYINFLLNITKDCDCHAEKQKPILKDIGLLASTDPVAIDKASFDLTTKNNKGKKLFRGDDIFNYAEKIGLGKTKYELIEI
ncbi:MAG: DUF362 domain-containing protein [Candidatus Iainarchaeum sp.]|jgi:uncharacterized Fe-S center protein